jgi:hypothetical protein
LRDRRYYIGDASAKGGMTVVVDFVVVETMLVRVDAGAVMLIVILAIIVQVFSVITAIMPPQLTLV